MDQSRILGTKHAELQLPTLADRDKKHPPPHNEFSPVALGKQENKCCCHQVGGVLAITGSHSKSS